jgi:hypothetical protein
MLLKLGVSIEYLGREIRRALDPIEKIYFDAGEGEAVITETRGGTHKPGSLHYADDAIDIRLPKKNVGELAQEMRRKLGVNYDVVVEISRVHCEYDPK